MSFDVGPLLVKDTLHTFHTFPFLYVPTEKLFGEEDGRLITFVRLISKQDSTHRSPCRETTEWSIYRRILGSRSVSSYVRSITPTVVLCTVFLFRVVTLNLLERSYKVTFLVKQVLSRF